MVEQSLHIGHLRRELRLLGKKLSLNYERPVITIDGPAVSGKGTLAVMLATEMRWNLLDSGMYFRAMAYLCMEKNVAPLDKGAVIRLVKSRNFVTCRSHLWKSAAFL